MAYHKGRGISFGGVHDVEESEEGIESEFFNQLFVWNIDRNRFFQLPLRRPRVGAKKVTQAQETTKSRRARGRADEEELLANLKNLETRGALASENAQDIVPTSVDGESGKEGRAEKPTIWEMPHPRFNAQLAVQDDVLYIFGGTFEKGDREYTFDEMWAIDLGKLDGAKEIFRRELEDWQGSDSEEEDEEDLEGEGSSSEEEDGEQSDTASTAATTVSVAPSVQPEKPDVYETAEEASEQSALKDDLPHPRPFESLRDFFARTSEAWQNVLLGEAQYGMSRTEARAVKEIRKEAFERAETKWWDCREEIQALEDEQEEAGIGEVITLGKDAVGAGGPGRRR